MSVIKIVPLNPYIMDEATSSEPGDAWICIDRRWVMAAPEGSGFVNIQLDDVMAADLMAQLGGYFARRVYRGPSK